MSLLPVQLNSPGRWGINLQEADQLLHPNWATIADGMVLSDSDQLAARGSITITSTTPAAAELLRIFNYINAAGTEIVISATATTMWQSVGDLTASGNNITPTGAPTNGFWKFNNFNGKVTAWQAGHTPLVYSGSGDFTTITAASGTLPDGDVSHAAFGRMWAVDDDKQTVRYSALLDETRWATADGGGAIDMRNVWTQGIDYVTAISSLGANLIIFGRKHVVFYTDGLGSAVGVDPSQMYVVDVIEGTGCVSRDSVVPIGEGDLVFLSEVGLQSLARVVQSKDNPLTTISWQISDRLTSAIKTELGAQASPATDVRGFFGIYLPNTGQYLLIHNNGSVEDVYCFHMDSRAQDEKGRDVVPVTIWDTSVLPNFRAAIQLRGGTTYFIGGVSNHINTYNPSGSLDNGIVPIPIDWESGWMAWEDPQIATINKVLKFVQITHSNNDSLASTTTFKFGTDYAPTLDSETGPDANGNPVRTIFDPVGDIEGQNFKIGIEDGRFGGKAIQQVLMHFKPGRIAFVHSVEGQVVDSSDVPDANLQLLIAVSDSNSSTSCVQTSMDGINWTIRTAIQAAWQSVCYSQDLHLAVAVANNSIMTSPDGVNWTSRTSPGNGGWTAVCYSRELGKFVAVGQSLTTQRVMTSANGIDWTLQTTPSNCDRLWTSVIWSSRLRAFVAGQSASTANGIMTSADGVTWVRGTIIGDTHWLTESANYVLAVQSGDSDVTYAADAVNWTNVENAGAATVPGGVAYSPDLDLFAIAGGVTTYGIYTAPGSDPSTWTQRATTGFQFRCGCWSTGLSLFVFLNTSAANNEGAYSADGITWTPTTLASTQNWVSICETEEV